ncbi:hypothetical protein K1719_039338 [Acacia pycnantha]|nr:hypothetical protein K1719_039338 [Acacia pycnantha]
MGPRNPDRRLRFHRIYKVDVEDTHGNISSRTLDVSTLTQYDWEDWKHVTKDTKNKAFADILQKKFKLREQHKSRGDNSPD